MNTITIPKKITKGEELIVIPRKEYEEFLRLSKKRTYTSLDRDLDEAITEVKAGKIIGPFETAKALIKSLKPKSLSKR